MKPRHDSISAIRNEGALLNDYFLREKLPEEFARFTDRDRALWAATNLPMLWRKAERRLGPDMSAHDARDCWYEPLLNALGFTPTWTPGIPIETERGLMPVSGFQADNSACPLVFLSYHSPGTDVDRDAFTAFPGCVKGSIDRALDTLANQVNGECRYAIALYGKYARLYRGGNDIERQFIEVDFEILSENADRAEWLVFYALFNVAAFAPDDSGRTGFERMQIESVRNADKVADDLSANIRDAVETLVQGALDNPENHVVFGNGVTRPDVAAQLYDEGLYVLYRLLFALYAEARGLFDLNNPLYRAYSVEHLRELAEEPESPLHARSYYFWDSCKALFRLILDGSPVSALNMPSYGGQLFAPSKIKWLGQCRIADNALRKTIRELSLSKPKGRHPRRRIAYGLLGVTQLGYIYENLLALRPNICAKPWVTVQHRDKKVLMPLEQAHDLGLDDVVVEHHRTGTFLLSSWDGQRKGDGAFFTREYITRYLVEETLRPLTQGRSSEQILQLKVCDPAMGSGTFLVPAARFLTREYIRALREECILDDEPTERKRAELKREIITRCLYGVDISPKAVDLAKVSLWIETADSQMPLDFLDEHLRAGNSLIGAHPEMQVKLKGKTPPKRKGESLKTPPTCTVAMTEFLPQEAYGNWISAHEDAEERKEARNTAKSNQKNIEDLVSGQLLLTDDLAHDTIRDGVARRRPFLRPARTVEDVQSKESLSQRWRDDPATRATYLKLNLWCAVWFWPPDAHVPPPTTYDYKLIEAKLIDEIGKDSSGKSLDERWHEALSERERRQLAVAQEVTNEQRFFHWHVEFPEVFGNIVHRNGVQGQPERGFDAILGNPPWNTIKPYGMEFFCQYDPTLHVLEGKEAEQRIEAICEQIPSASTAWLRHRASIAALSAFFRESGIYQHIGFGDLDTYKLFCERVYILLWNRQDEVSGRAGIVMSGSLHKAGGARALRELLYSNTRIDALLKFDNEAKWFGGIHHSTKFDLLVFEKGGVTETLPAVFAAFLDPPFDAYKERSDDLLPDIEQYKVQIPISLIQQLSPEAWSPLEFRNQSEIEVCKKMCQQPMLGKELPGRWRIRLTTDLHVSGDKEAFHDEPDGYPLYEGKMFDQFNHRSQTYHGGVLRDVEDDEWQDRSFRIQAQHYVYEDEGRRRIASGEVKRFQRALTTLGLWNPEHSPPITHRDVPLGCDSYRLAYRDVASSVVWRTTIATILPSGIFCNHKCIVSLPAELDEEALGETREVAFAYRNLYDEAELCYVVAMLNSFVTDWYVRLRVGTSLTYGLFEEIPMPRLSHGDAHFSEVVRRCGQLVCTTPEFDRLAQEIGLGNNLAGVLDLSERLRLRCELDAYAALLYGLSVQEFASVLDTFRVFRDKELQEYGEFRSKRLCLQAFAALTGQEIAEEWETVAISPPSRPHQRTAAERRYGQGHVFIDIVRESESEDGKADKHLGRVKMAKDVYAVQEFAKVALGYKFSRAQFGPLDTDLYRIETLARRQGWLLLEKQATGGDWERVVYRPGPLAREAAAQARHIYGDKAEAVGRVLADFRPLTTRQAEHWTTVHFVWKEFLARGRPFTPADVIEDVYQWKGHRQNFSREDIGRTLETLVNKGYIRF